MNRIALLVALVGVPLVDASGANPTKIFEIKAVCVDRPANGHDLSVRVVGNARTTGWSDPQLRRHVYEDPPKDPPKPPADRIQDFDFVATPPEGFAGQLLWSIEARIDDSQDITNYWGSGDPLEGVRIHSEAKQPFTCTFSKESDELQECCCIADRTGGGFSDYPCRP